MIFYNIYILAPIPNQLAIEYPVQSITATNVKSTSAAIPKTSTTASIPPPAPSVGEPAVDAAPSSIQNTVEPEPSAQATAAAAPTTAAPTSAAAPTTGAAPTTAAVPTTGAAPPLAAAPSSAAPPPPLQAAPSSAAPPPPLQAAPLQYSTAQMISEAYLNPVVSLIPVSNPRVENGAVNYDMERYLR